MKVALIGYGKMGKSIEKIFMDKGHDILCVIDKKEDINLLLDNHPDLAIEFTQPDVVLKNLVFCLENHIKIITGTTGWLKSYNQIVQLCKKKNGTFLYSSNYSIGVNLFFELNKWLAKSMSGQEFKISMEEIHHTEKKDSPSGTAIQLAEDIVTHHSKYDSWTKEKSKKNNEINIVSKRMADVTGTHIVTYSSSLESIEIVHKALDRNVFADGVLQVAEWIYAKQGVFQMSDFINDKLKIKN